MGSREIIKRTCQERGISVRQLEMQLGFSNGSIANSASLSSDRLYKVAQFFSLPMEYFITGEMPAFTTPPRAILKR